MAGTLCVDVNKDGGPCRAYAVKGGDRCPAHSGVDMAELGRAGSVAQTSRRQARQALAEATNESADRIIASLLEVLDAEVTKYGDCPGCGKRVGVTWADSAGRARVAELLLNQSFGMPGTSLHVTSGEPTFEDEWGPGWTPERAEAAMRATWEMADRHEAIRAELARRRDRHQ